MKRNPFSLIEIALSMGVAFLAVTVLIAFFPTSFKRIETAQNLSYSTNASQQLISYLKSNLLIVPTPPKVVKTVSGVPGAYTYTYETVTGDNNDYPEYEKKWEDNISKNDSVDSNPTPLVKSNAVVDYTAYSSLSTSDIGTNIEQHPTIKSIYFIRSVTESSNIALIDAAIEARVWKSSYTAANRFHASKDVYVHIHDDYDTDPGLNAAYSNQSASGSLSYTNTTSPDTSAYISNDYDKHARINIELSWPTSIPYADRTKKLYFFTDFSK